MDTVSKVTNGLLGISSAGVFFALLKNLRNVENVDERDKLSLEYIETLGLLVWPILFDQIVGFKEMIRDKKLIVSFLIPIVKSVVNIIKLRKLSVEEFKKEYKNKEDERPKILLLGQVLAFASFMNTIIATYKINAKNTYKVLASSFVLSFLSDAVLTLLVGDKVKKYHVNAIKTILSTYSLAFLIYVTMANMSKVIGSGEGSNNKKKN